MTKIPKKQNFLVIGDWILFGPALAGLEFGDWNLTIRGSIAIANFLTLNSKF